MDRVIVLKFGGSVLADSEALDSAVHEVYRWRRGGWRVLAVVSALAGRTDELEGSALAVQGRIPTTRAERLARAALVGLGELESAALLGARLAAAGLEARVLDPVEVGLVAHGDPLDASPTRVAVEPLRRVLGASAIAVFPGFVAQSEPEGARVLLGRGGSDLTALFLAEALGARCRLVKDVDGLFEWDPARTGPRAPRRYGQIRWDDALALDGSILQRKALEFAKDKQMTFELAAPGSARATTVGARTSRWSTGAEARPPLRVAVLGGGVVGGGVVELLRADPIRFELVGVAVRDRSRPRAGIAGQWLCEDPVALAGSGADVVVEALGGVEPAASAVACALEAGSHVVTANKRVLAERGDELSSLAARRGRALVASAAVGGVAPILEALERGRDRGPRLVRARLNGTAGFVLAALRRGESLTGALAQARALGLAEADAARDLNGRDAADKLCVMGAALGLGLRPERVVRGDPIDAHTGALASAAAGRGEVLAQVGELRFDPRTGWSARVGLERLRPDDPLAEFEAETCGARLSFANGSSELVAGGGAGRRPTAEAVLADLFDLWRLEGAGAPATFPCAAPRS